MAKIVVPDASILIKWALNSPDENSRDNAMAFLNAWLGGRVAWTASRSLTFRKRL